MMAVKTKWQQQALGVLLGSLVSCGASQADRTVVAQERSLKTEQAQPVRAVDARVSGAGKVQDTSEIGASQNPQKPSLEGEPHAVLTGFTFESLLKEPIHSLAIGKAPRLAVLGNEPWFFDTAGWRMLPIPPHLKKKQGELEEMEIFFGRDNQPRLMGHRVAPETRNDVGRFSPVYLRHKATGWQKEPSELGQLGQPEGALYGILGEADPEVVCRPRQICLIKRVSGWQQSLADSAPALIEMHGSQVFKVVNDAVFELHGAVWREVVRGLPDGPLTSVWGTPAGALFVVAAGRVLRRENNEWILEQELTRQTKVLVGSDDENLWAIGAGSPCRRGPDGRWACARGEFGDLSVAKLVPDGTMYFGGSTGLWSARATTDSHAPAPTH